MRPSRTATTSTRPPRGRCGMRLRRRSTCSLAARSASPRAIRAATGARAEVAEGVIVREGSVLSMGVYLGASTKIVDRATGEVLQGEVPPYSVVVSGTMPGKAMANGEPGPGLYCAVIVKRVDEKTRS